MERRVTHSLVRALQDVPGFESLDERRLLELIGDSANLYWPAGSTVFERGGPSDGLYIVISGRVEVTALLVRANPRYLTGHRDRCLMQLMLHAGLRAAEVLALTVYDLDWLSGQLTVRQGKGQKDRILWLNEALLDDLRRER